MPYGMKGTLPYHYQVLQLNSGCQEYFLQQALWDRRSYNLSILQNLVIVHLKGVLAMDFVTLGYCEIFRGILCSKLLSCYRA